MNEIYSPYCASRVLHSTYTSMDGRRTTFKLLDRRPGAHLGWFLTSSYMSGILTKISVLVRYDQWTVCPTYNQTDSHILFNLLKNE